MATGYIGPRTIPIMETEMADAMKEGTSQTINWKLCERLKMGFIECEL